MTFILIANYNLHIGLCCDCFRIDFQFVRVDVDIGTMRLSLVSISVLDIHFVVNGIVP